MKLLRLASVILVGGAVAASACGSSDQQIARQEAGAGGEAGTRPDSQQAGSSAQADFGGAPSDAGAAGAAPLAAGGQAGSTAAGGDTNGGAAGVAGQGGASTETVLDLGFEDSDTLPANLDPGTAVLTPSQGYAPLGPEGNQFGDTFLRGPTGTVITLTLSDLPPHTTLSLSMLFAAIDSLDGEGTFPAGDYFKITLDDEIVFRESFANAIETQIQSYDPPPEVILARHVDLGFGGPGGYYTDSAYDFGLDPDLQELPHTAASATLVFTLEGDGVQSVDDESWAIDNIRVSVH
jgi:hypothetical protein